MSSLSFELDGYQPKARKQSGMPIHMPILHLPQLIGLALGFSTTDMGLERHIISTDAITNALKESNPV